MAARVRWQAIAVGVATAVTFAATVPVLADAGARAGAGATDIAAPRVRTIPVALAGGWDLPRGDAWSPSGSRLALVSRGRLAIWDASRPDDAPRPILDARVDDVRWSPDGSWLCCRVRIANATRGGAVRLQFVPAEGGVAEYRIPNAAIGPWLWAADGFVYFWNGQTGERRRVDPPRAWRELGWQHTGDAEPPQLVLAPSGERRRPPRALLFTSNVVGGEPVETQLDSLVAPGGVQPWCGFREPQSAAPRWIVTFHDREGEARTCVVDATGRRHPCWADAAGRPFEDLTVSADGRWALGTVCTRPRDGTASRCEARLYATSGEWSQALEGIDAARLQFDRSSPLVAIAVREPRGVRIARVELAGAP